MEGAATTVYATGGRGNARLIAWEGERTVTFTMEDALISPEGFSILTGAGLIDGDETPVIMHTTEQTNKVKFLTDTGTEITAASNLVNLDHVEIELSQEPYLGQNVTYTPGTEVNPVVQQAEDFIYVMVMKDGDIISEPFIPSETTITKTTNGTYTVSIYKTENSGHASDNPYDTNKYRQNDLSVFYLGCVVFVDYYVKKAHGAYQVNITPDKFGGNFYLEASTLFRDTNGTDLPAEFIIPNCKIQSNFSFSLASSGDPSTFTFTMDAFPDYTRWDQTKKVFAAIQVYDVGAVGAELERLGTKHNNTNIASDYNSMQKPYIEL